MARCQGPKLEKLCPGVVQLRSKREKLLHLDVVLSALTAAISESCSVEM